MPTARTLLLGITSVAVAALGVWWLGFAPRKQIADNDARKPQQDSSEKQRKQRYDDAVKPQSPAPKQQQQQRPSDDSPKQPKAATAAPLVPAPAPTPVTEVPTAALPSTPATPSTAIATAAAAASANVTVRKKQQDEAIAAQEADADEDDFISTSSPIAYDPDRANDEAEALTESMDAAETFPDNVVTSLPEISQCGGDEGDDRDYETLEVQEDVHLIATDNLDESTSAFDMSTSAIDMSTSALEESKEVVEVDTASEAVADDAVREDDQAQVSEASEQKTKKKRPRRKNKSNANSFTADASVTSENGADTPAESSPLRSVADIAQAKPGQQKHKSNKTLKKKSSYRVSK